MNTFKHLANQICYLCSWSGFFLPLVSRKKKRMRWEMPLKRGSLDEVRFFTFMKRFSLAAFYLVKGKKERKFYPRLKCSFVNFKWGSHGSGDSINSSLERRRREMCLWDVKSLTDDPPGGHLQCSLNMRNRFSGSMSKRYSSLSFRATRRLDRKSDDAFL